MLALVLFVTSSVFVQSCNIISFKNISLHVYMKSSAKPSSAAGCLTPQTMQDYQNIQKKKLMLIGIHNQNIPILYEEAVANFTDNFKLYFSNNTINSIMKNAFTNLPGLNRLGLRHNSIFSVEEIANLPSLQNVDLSWNNLGSLHVNTFHNLPALEKLDLNHNQLQFFEQEWFNNVKNLQNIDASYNLIEVISQTSFFEFHNLQFLNLEHNQISQIHPNAFSTLPKLQGLNLRFNKLKKLDIDFSHLSVIQELILDMNKLTSVSDITLNQISNSIKNLVIIPNPLQCSCYTKILQWTKENNVKMNKLQCSSRKSPICILPFYDTRVCLEEPVKDSDISTFYENFEADCDTKQV